MDEHSEKKPLSKGFDNLRKINRYRLGGKHRAILTELYNQEAEVKSYELRETLREEYGVRVSTGAFYQALSRLEDAGLTEHRRDTEVTYGHTLRVRFESLTEPGRNLIQALETLDVSDVPKMPKPELNWRDLIMLSVLSVIIFGMAKCTQSVFYFDNKNDNERDQPERVEPVQIPQAEPAP